MDRQQCERTRKNLRETEARKGVYVWACVCGRLKVSLAVPGRPPGVSDVGGKA